MKRMKIFGLIVAALVAVAVTVAVVWPSDEPSWHGRKLTEWIKHLGGGYWLTGGQSIPIDKLEPEARKAIKQIGTNAMPTIIKLLEAKDSALKRRLIHFLNNQGLFDIHLLTAEEKQHRALTAVGILRTNARAAAPQLLKLSGRNNKNYITGSADAMLSVTVTSNSQDYLNVLKEGFQNPNAEVSHAAAGCLQRDFPQEAEQLGITKKFPDLGSAPPSNNSTNAVSAK